VRPPVIDRASCAFLINKPAEARKAYALGGLKITDVVSGFSQTDGRSVGRIKIGMAQRVAVVTGANRDWDLRQPGNFLHMGFASR
jgi:hypothetical protein